MLLNRLDVCRRVVEIAYRHHLSHLGSCLTSVDILCDIYESRCEDDPVVLSNGHAGLALYAVLEAVYGLDAEDLEQRHGVHPTRNERDRIYASTGSLGMGLPIALGMALANRGRRVFCVLSDGECAEGSVWEALAVKTKYHVENLRVFVNLNGFAAYDPVDGDELGRRLRCFDPSVELRFTECKLPFAPGCQAHYHMLSEDEYLWLLDHLETVS
jgi:transketolase